MIKDIIGSKKKHDEICLSKKLPKETLESYIYTYLNNKYGLKNIVIEWTIALLNALKLFRSDIHEVDLFCQVLKNECEEDFFEA
jgi:hypothetical protein